MTHLKPSLLLANLDFFIQSHCHLRSGDLLNSKPKPRHNQISASSVVYRQKQEYKQRLDELLQRPKRRQERAKQRQERAKQRQQPQEHVITAGQSSTNPTRTQNQTIYEDTLKDCRKCNQSRPQYAFLSTLPNNDTLRKLCAMCNLVNGIVTRALRDNNNAGNPPDAVGVRSRKTCSKYVEKWHAHVAEKGLAVDDRSNMMARVDSIINNRVMKLRAAEAATANADADANEVQEGTDEESDEYSGETSDVESDTVYDFASQVDSDDLTDIDTFEDRDIDGDFPAQPLETANGKASQKSRAYQVLPKPGMRPRLKVRFVGQSARFDVGGSSARRTDLEADGAARKPNSNLSEEKLEGRLRENRRRMKALDDGSQEIRQILWERVQADKRQEYEAEVDAQTSG